MLKGKKIRIIAIAITFIAVLGVTVFAKQATETISVIYDNIKILIDGVEFTAKDVNGNVIEPFIYNGTTYLPVRGIANAFDKNVEWDAQTSTVVLGSKNYDWLDQMGYVDYSTTRKVSEVYSLSDFEYDNGTISRGINFVVSNPDYDKKDETVDNTYISYLLNNNYQKFTAEIIPMDNYYASDIKPSVLTIYGDNKVIYSSPRITEKSDSINLELDVANIKVLKIEVTTELKNNNSICGRDRERYIVLSNARLEKR